MASRDGGARRGRRAAGNTAVAGVLVLGTLCSFALSAEVERAEDRALQRAVEARTGTVSFRLEQAFEARILALERMTDRWTVAGGTRQEVWEEDAGNYVADFGGFEAIERLDATGRIVWVVPQSSSAWLLGYDVSEDPQRRPVMDEAWRRGRAAVSPPLDLLTGGRGVLVYLPLYAPDRFDGWVAGTFEMDDLLSSTLGQPGTYRVAVTFDEMELYADPRPAHGICAHRVIGVFYLGWRVQVCAGEELEGAIRGPLPYVTLAVGLVLTALTGGLLRALQLAGARERRAEALAVTLSEKANDLDRAQRELAELSWSVSHELRTPLRAIDGHAAMLADAVPEEGKEALGRIRANAKRMASQLDGLLRLLRVARVELDVREVDVSALARDRLARLAAAEPEREVQARVDPGLVVKGDEALLTVVVDELVDNAWKFTASRKPGHIEVVRTATGFCVCDDGVGFDMAFAHKLFATFERLHGPGEFEGLGLGLATAARAVGRHGGRIRAEGTPGKGAVFSVELPD